uniref:chaperone protein dnaJ 10-like n=1 Tax=Styela clava TaxID=7725 RepID=UPI00193AC8DB|nr:chaperone protein dnaJ 10-like [Styela clava]
MSVFCRSLRISSKKTFFLNIRNVARNIPAQYSVALCTIVHKETNFPRVFVNKFSSDAASNTDDLLADPYKILELDPGASAKEIRNAYINLSKQNHPDNNPADEQAKEQFILINNAYRKIMETLEKHKDADLKDDQMDKAYDFTISPAGVETEETQPQVSSDWLMIKKVAALFFFLFIFIQYFRDPLLDRATLYYKENYGPTREDLNHQMKEKLRNTIIEKHKEQEEAKRIMQDAQSFKRHN